MVNHTDEVTLANQALALAQDAAEAAWTAAYDAPQDELAWEDADTAETWVAQAAARLATVSAEARLAATS